MKLATQRPPDSEETSKSETPPVKPAHEEAAKYKPSGGRLYGGLAMFGLPNPSGPGWLTTFGAALAFDGSLGDENLFYLGARISIVGNAGVIGAFDLDFGMRPAIPLGDNSAVIFLLGGGIGGGFISVSGTPTQAFFHLPLRLGIGVDVSAFTAEIVLGPAFLAGNGTLGLFEGMAEAGVRF